MMNKVLCCLIVIFFFTSTICAQVERDTLVDFSTLYSENDAVGCAVIYDLQNDKYIRYNPVDCNKGYLPASTFKIPNTLILLETKTAENINHTLKWDGKERGIKSWNKDHTLETAFKNSAVWYYEEMTHRVGLKKEKEFLELMDYGNTEISGDFPFWLDGNLRISANQQVDFLKKFYSNELPFKDEYIANVKEFMILEKDSSYTLRGKTGWARPDNIEVGWLVGYIESAKGVFIYAVNVRAERGNKKFSKARKEIALSILNELGLFQ